LTFANFKFEKIQLTGNSNNFKIQKLLPPHKKTGLIEQRGREYNQMNPVVFIRIPVAEGEYDG
jgi:hypothetical protein